MEILERRCKLLKQLIIESVTGCKMEGMECSEIYKFVNEMSDDEVEKMLVEYDLDK